MLKPTHPAAILRLAWKRVRLDAIRAAATTAIEEVQELDRRDLVPAPDVSDTEMPSASTAALRACVRELREESGLQPVAIDAREPSLPDDPLWSESYALHLARYRTAAGSALSRLLVESSGSDRPG